MRCTKNSILVLASRRIASEPRELAHGIVELTLGQRDHEPDCVPDRLPNHCERRPGTLDGPIGPEQDSLLGPTQQLTPRFDLVGGAHAELAAQPPHSGLGLRQPQSDLGLDPLLLAREPVGMLRDNALHLVPDTLQVGECAWSAG